MLGGEGRGTVEERNGFLRRIDQLLVDLNQRRPWLAEQSGIKIGTINSWYHNNRYPYVNHAQSIADALGTTVDYLMTGREPERGLEDPTIAEIIDYLESLTPKELQRCYGMLQLARAMRLAGDTSKDNRAVG